MKLFVSVQIPRNLTAYPKFTIPVILQNQQDNKLHKNQFKARRSAHKRETSYNKDNKLDKTNSRPEPVPHKQETSYHKQHSNLQIRN